jgi:hypothetical protein
MPVAAPPQPEHRPCPNGCGTVVLVATTHDGNTVILDPDEWQPRMQCPVCLGKRRKCQRCGGSRYVGEKSPAPSDALRLSEDGVVRTSPPSKIYRAAGEAVHRRHECPSADIAFRQ